MAALVPADKYVPYGMHHSDTAYDVNDPALTPRQRELVEFSENWFNEPTQPKPVHDDNPGMVRIHELAKEPDAATVEYVEGWCGPRGSGVVPFQAPPGTYAHL